MANKRTREWYYMYSSNYKKKKTVHLHICSEISINQYDTFINSRKIIVHFKDAKLCYQELVCPHVVQQVTIPFI